MNISDRDPDLQDSLNPHGKPIKSLLAFLLQRSIGFAWGLVLLTTVGSYAIYLGGTVTTEVTPTHIRVEVVGRPR